MGIHHVPLILEDWKSRRRGEQEGEGVEDGVKHNEHDGHVKTRGVVLRAWRRTEGLKRTMEKRAGFKYLVGGHPEKEMLRSQTFSKQISAKKRHRFRPDLATSPVPGATRSPSNCCERSRHVFCKHIMVCYEIFEQPVLVIPGLYRRFASPIFAVRPIGEENQWYFGTRATTASGSCRKRDCQSLQNGRCWS